MLNSELLIQIVPNTYKRSPPKHPYIFNEESLPLIVSPVHVHVHVSAAALIIMSFAQNRWVHYLLTNLARKKERKTPWIRVVLPSTHALTHYRSRLSTHTTTHGLSRKRRTLQLGG